MLPRARELVGFCMECSTRERPFCSRFRERKRQPLALYSAQLRGRPIRPTSEASRRDGCGIPRRAATCRVGLTDDLNELPLAGSRALPAFEEDPEIVFASNERCIDAGPGASAAAGCIDAGPGASAAAGSNDPVEGRSARHALELVWPFLFNDEQACDLLADGRRYQHRFGSAAFCTRAATFGASPNTSPAASTTTGQLSSPMRAASFGNSRPTSQRSSPRLREGPPVRRGRRVRHRSPGPSDIRIAP